MVKNVLGVLAVLVIVLVGVPIALLILKIDPGQPAVPCGNCPTGLDVADAVVVGLLAASLVGVLIAALGAVVIASGAEKSDDGKLPYVMREQRRRASRDRIITGISILVIGALLIGLAPLVGAAAGTRAESPTASSAPSPEAGSSVAPPEPSSSGSDTGPGFVICPSGCTILPLPSP